MNQKQNQNFKASLRRQSQMGQITLQLMIFGFVGVTILSGFVLWADTNARAGVREYNKALAFTIAESGIEYYRWHLAHAPNDYEDGTGGAGPYTHDFFDKDSNLLGTYTLTITPPTVGSTIVDVRSAGRVLTDVTVDKKVSVRMGKPSFAQYSTVSNAPAMRFGAGTQVYGRLHSNGGIRFDAIAYNLVTSSMTAYDDPDHIGGNEFGVHTHVAPVDPLPPANVPARTDIFKVGRTFPVPSVDFSGITQDLAQIKAQAQAGGQYIGPSNRVRTKSSGTTHPAFDAGEGGYEIILKTDNTYDLYRVLSLFWWNRNTNPGQWSNCYMIRQDGWWSTWSIQNKSLIGNFPFPANGLIFVEDDVWISGQINNARLTIAAARFPTSVNTYAKILIENDLFYTNYDGRDSIGLIAQGNVTTGMRSKDTIRIDAALIAQNGWVGRYYYTPYTSVSRPGCSIYDRRQRITLYGMIGTNQRYGFAYTDGTGYQDRIIIYDGNLLYGPPPSFPLATNEYQTLTWDEVK